MPKRISWFLMIWVGIGGFFWLSEKMNPKHGRFGEAGPVERDRDINPQMGDSAYSENDGTVVPESPRHVAREMERHQQWKSKFAGLEREILDQEDKVEERRKLLAIIVRTKIIIYQVGDDSSHTDEHRQRGDSTTEKQEYVDVQKDFEMDQQVLQELRLKLIFEKMKMKEKAGR